MRKVYKSRKRKTRKITLQQMMQKEKNLAVITNVKIHEFPRPGLRITLGDGQEKILACAGMTERNRRLDPRKCAHFLSQPICERVSRISLNFIFAPER